MHETTGGCMNARERRRESRAAKQAEWKAANPLLVGINSTKGKQALRPTLSLSRKASSRVDKALIARDTPVYDDMDNCCLPQVSLFRAGHRGKPNNPFHVQK